MTRHLHIVRSEPVDIHELFAENIQREDGRHFRLSSLRDRAASRLAALRFNPGRSDGVPDRARLGLMSPARRFKSFHSNLISGDCFFLITGAMVALDLCLIVWLSQR